MDIVINVETVVGQQKLATFIRLGLRRFEQNNSTHRQRRFTAGFRRFVLASITSSLRSLKHKASIINEHYTSMDVTSRQI